MQNERIEAIEQDLKPEGEREVEYWTINCVIVETYFENGERLKRELPAQYDDNVPFGEPFYHTELKRWVAIRYREPLKEPARTTESFAIQK